MIKLILSIVALVLIGLSLYVYMDKESTPSTKPSVHKATMAEKSSSKKEPAKTASVKKVEQVAQEKVSHKSTPVEKSSVVSSNEASVQAEEEIGKGLTLESIENADVSDEEKERMRMDMLYLQSKHSPEESTLSDEVIEKMMEEDLAKGLIK